MSLAIKGRTLVRKALPAVGRIAQRALRTRVVRRRRRPRRGRGISGTELRGFKKVARLLASFGMRPRGLAGSMRRGGRRPFR